MTKVFTCVSPTRVLGPVWVGSCFSSEEEVLDIEFMAKDKIFIHKRKFSLIALENQRLQSMQ